MGYELVDFKTLGDDRGSLIALEENYNTPFAIKRVYYIFDTKEGVRRGENEKEYNNKRRGSKIPS